MSKHLRQSGFNLIELMISVTISLIVMGAAVALMVSIMQANGQNIASTRLNQELRTVAEVVVRDLKRARYYENTIYFVGEMNDDDDGNGRVQNCGDIDPVTGDEYVPPACDWRPNDAAFKIYENVAVTPNAVADDGVATTVDGTCIRYSYQDATPAVTPFHAILRAPDPTGVGTVWLARGAADPGCIRETRLSSQEVNITNLAFNYAPADDWVRITVSGSLVSDPTIVRQFTTSLRFRSQPVPL